MKEYTISECVRESVCVCDVCGSEQKGWKIACVADKYWLHLYAWIQWEKYWGQKCERKYNLYRSKFHKYQMISLMLCVWAIVASVLYWCCAVMLRRRFSLLFSSSSSSTSSCAWLTSRHNNYTNLNIEQMQKKKKKKKGKKAKCLHCHMSHCRAFLVDIGPFSLSLARLAACRETWDVGGCVCMCFMNFQLDQCVYFVVTQPPTETANFCSSAIHKN